MSTALLPLVIFIFLAKVAELTVSTSRTILVVSGLNIQAALLGFVEITIGIVAVGAVVTNLDKPIAIFAYAAGFAVGIIAGGWVEEQLAFGYRTVRIINPKGDFDASTALRQRGFPVTQLDGLGLAGAVEVAFVVIERRSLRNLLTVVAAVAPRSFVTVERTDRPIRGTVIRGKPWWRRTPSRSQSQAGKP